MLVLTGTAISAIRRLVDGSELPEGGGVRIASRDTGGLWKLRTRD